MLSSKLDLCDSYNDHSESRLSLIIGLDCVGLSLRLPLNSGGDARRFPRHFTGGTAVKHRSHTALMMPC